MDCCRKALQQQLWGQIESRYQSETGATAENEPVGSARTLARSLWYSSQSQASPRTSDANPCLSASGKGIRRTQTFLGTAPAIREIFNQYLRLRTVPALKAYLDESSVRSKIHIENGGKVGGGKFSRGALYKFLRNHLYVGQIAHKGEIHEGEHEGIILREQWDQVQRLLDENRQGNRIRSQSSQPSLLTGLVFDEAGNRFTPTHAQKSGRRYRYYTSQSAIRSALRDGSVRRVAALDLENAVLGKILEFLGSTEEILRAADDSGKGTLGFDRILRASIEQSKRWARLSRAEQGAVLRVILKRVVIHQNSVEIQLNSEALFGFLLGEKQGERSQSPEVEPHIVSLSSPFRIAPRGKAVCVVLGTQQTTSIESASAIIRAIARARSWYEEIVSGEVNSVPELAARHSLTPRYVKKMLPYAFLSPGSVETILNTKSNPRLTLEYIRKHLPIRWDQQTEWSAR